MKRNFSFVLVILALSLILVSCSAVPTNNSKTEISVIALKGPTGMGLAKLMDDNESKTASNSYVFSVLSSPDDATAEIIKGSCDIAALPTNLAAVLNKKTDGELQIIALNTLGTLYILENGNTVNSISDLNGKTLYATGKGAVPEYVLSYLLEKNGIECTVEYLTEHSELATKMAAGEITLGLLPEPNVTSVLMQNSDVHVALNLTEEWSRVADGELVMGCLVARKDFIEKNPEAVAAFLGEYKKSVDFVNANTDEASLLIEKFGIVPKAAMAKAAIPGSNMVCITGDEMKSTVKPFLEILYEANPKSVGGTLPDEIFYFVK